MDEIMFTAKALAAIAAADAAIVSTERETFGKVVAKYCALGTKVRELPGALNEDGTVVHGFATKVIEAEAAEGHVISPARMSRALTIAYHGKDGYEAYVEHVRETNESSTLTNLIAFLKGDDDAPPPPKLTGQKLVADVAHKAAKAALRAVEHANLNTRQRRAVLQALIAELEGEES